MLFCGEIQGCHLSVRAEDAAQDGGQAWRSRTAARADLEGPWLGDWPSPHDVIPWGDSGRQCGEATLPQSSGFAQLQGSGWGIGEVCTGWELGPSGEKVPFLSVVIFQ